MTSIFFYFEKFNFWKTNKIWQDNWIYALSEQDDDFRDENAD